MTCLGPSSTIDAHSEHCKGREEETYSNTIHEQRQGGDTRRRAAMDSIYVKKGDDMDFRVSKV